MAINVSIPRWRITELTGYKPITTFWEDFSIADRFGIAAVKDTYRKAFNEWKNNYKYMTELVMVLNHKNWQYYYEKDVKLARVYNDLWEQADAWCCENLKDEELEYFYETTD